MYKLNLKLQMAVKEETSFTLKNDLKRLTRKIIPGGNAFERNDLAIQVLLLLTQTNFYCNFFPFPRVC
jgi:hypothetical protein